MRTTHHIIETDDSFCVVKIFEIGRNVVSKPLVYCNTLSEATDILDMLEDAPMNSASAGQVASIGIGPDGEPGVDLKKKKRWKVLRRLLKPNLVG